MTTLHFISNVNNPILDVVFVHGPGGNSIDSWSSKSGYWPEWIVDSNPSVRVSAVEYPYKITLFGGRALTISEHAIALMELLVSNNLGTRPIIFIAHSLGGVVVKEVLRQSSGISKEYRCIWENTVAVVFLATPTKLSNLFTGKLFFGLFGRPLGDEPSLLQDTNEFYRNQAPRRGITTLSFAAAKDIVAISVDPGVADAVVIPIDTSHVEISKPTSKNSLVVASVQRLISKIADLTKENKLQLGASNYE